jgi:hypothetical protein
MPQNSVPGTTEGVEKADRIPAPNDSCSAFDGMGSILGRRTWLKKWGFNVIAHELGHNIGLEDAGLDDGTSISSSVRYVDTDNINDGSDNGGAEGMYADASALMGYSKEWKGVNAANSARLGWIDETTIYHSSAIEDSPHPAHTSGSCNAKIVTITPLSDTPDTASTDTFTLVTADVVDSAHDAFGGKYYASLRVADGYDVNMKSDRDWADSFDTNGDYTGSTSGFVNQVSLHYGRAPKDSGVAPQSEYVIGLLKDATFTSDGRMFFFSSSVPLGARTFLTPRTRQVARGRMRVNVGSAF